MLQDNYFKYLGFEIWEIPAAHTGTLIYRATHPKTKVEFTEASLEEIYAKINSQVNSDT